MYDSTGYVHILTKSRIPHHACWARVMDTNLLERRKGKDETYWPVGINENNFMAVILKVSCFWFGSNVTAECPDYQGKTRTSRISSSTYARAADVYTLSQ